MGPGGLTSSWLDPAGGDPGGASVVGRILDGVDLPFFIHCGAPGSEQKEARAVVEGDIEAWPPRTTGGQVLLAAGDWWAIRGARGRVERAYCSRHHDGEGVYLAATLSP